jgi:hypothetical protein
VFSRFYRFQDFTCILPVSINSGITHKKSLAESIYLFSLVFAVFVIIVFWQIFKDCLDWTACFEDFFFYLSEGWGGGQELSLIIDVYARYGEKKPFMCIPAIEFLTPVAT